MNDNVDNVEASGTALVHAVNQKAKLLRWFQSDEPLESEIVNALPDRTATTGWKRISFDCGCVGIRAPNRYGARWKAWAICAQHTFKPVI